jgi:GT2 family glycosyltransferase
MDLVHHFGRPDVGAVSGTIQTPINPGYKDWSQEPVDFPEDLKVCNRMVVVDGVIQWLDKYQFYMHKSGPSVIGADFLGGTALFVRRELVQLWDLQSIREGGDGEWVIEGEEIDFCLSVRKLGYGLIYDASRICWHLFARSGRVRGSNYDQRIENWNYILGKHGFPLIDHYPSVWEKDLPPEWQPKS